MKVFDTGRQQGGRTVLVSFRLDIPRYKKLRARKINTRKVMEDYIDNRIIVFREKEEGIDS